jgi:hypothetical protein
MNDIGNMAGTNLTRRQLANIQIARGIPADEIQQRTGMPRASYDVLFGQSQGESDKEVTKMLSKTSFERLIALLGIEPDFCGLRQSGVLEWRADGTPKKTEARWVDATAAIVKELLSERLLIASVEQRRKDGVFGRWADTERMLLIFDRPRGIRIAITRAPADLLAKLEGLTGVTCQRQVKLSSTEFRDTREMIRHEVLRSVQFDHLTGLIMPTYSWKDVQAAAREFSFSTDDLVNMMHEMAERRSTQHETQQQHPVGVPEQGFGDNESVAEDTTPDWKNSDMQVARLRVVGG